MFTLRLPYAYFFQARISMVFAHLVLVTPVSINAHWDFCDDIDTSYEARIEDSDYEIPLMRLSRAIAAVGFTVKRGTWNTEHRKLYAKSLKYLERVMNC